MSTIDLNQSVQSPPASTGTLNLNSLPANATLKIEREETDGERYVRLFKDVALFIVAIGFVCVVVSLCFDTVKNSAASADDRKWAMSFLTAVAGGLVGYLVRK